MRTRIFCLFLFFTFNILFGQTVTDSRKTLQGTVYGVERHSSKADTIPLPAVNIFWNDTVIGTTTDNEGQFYLPFADEGNRLLIVSYIGFKNDTLTIRDDQPFVTVYLTELRTNEEILVEGEKPHEIRDVHSVINTEHITDAGLQTMACCTLAESFENTNSVDVERADAVSGAKRIKMLGLSGFYTQVMIEKKPVMRGLVSPYSLEYLPGNWIESISISKGTASVATGYESITGQINVELKKPEAGEPMLFNVYQNSMGRSEAVFTGAHQMNDKLSTMMLGYASYNNTKWDVNGDTFLDMPLVNHVNIMNRWKYKSDNRAAQIGFKIIRDSRKGGQTDFDFEEKILRSSYGSRSNTIRYEAYAKGGLSIDDNGSSIGMVISAFQHDQEAYWGAKSYTGKEHSVYANASANWIVKRHTLSTGLSYTFNSRDETYLTARFRARENIPGVYAEYTYKLDDVLTASAGYRIDHHELYGLFSTPRVHLKYQLRPETTIRLSAGKGYRTPYIFMDHPSILASSKTLVIQESIQAEEAWNGGIQFVQDFQLGLDKPASLIIDYYRTDFQNQVIADMEQNPQEILLYNLNGRSYSNSMQIELEATLAKGLESTIAFRLNDVKTTFTDQLIQVPMNSRYKGLLVLSYSPGNRAWQIDFTTQYNGKSRLPRSLGLVEFYQGKEYSPSYFLLFAQIQRKFKKWHIYAGVENITDYRQPNPIIAWQDPFGPHFDSSLIWGPTIGRRFYSGIRIYR